MDGFGNADHVVQGGDLVNITIDFPLEGLLVEPAETALALAPANKSAETNRPTPAARNP